MSESAVRKILVADSELGVRQKLTDFFSTVGYQVDTAEDDQDVLSKAAANDYAVAMVDCRLSGGSGLDVLAELSASYPETSVIMLSAEPSLKIVIAALRKGAFDFVVKPLDLTELTEIVHKAADQHELLKMYQAMSVQGRQGRDAGSQRGTASSRLTPP
jgi:two-component system response regulator AtoC